MDAIAQQEVTTDPWRYPMFDPKYDNSNTQRRHMLAVGRIPRLIGDLKKGKRTLDEKFVRLLYSEYRAYWRSRHPFHMRLQHCQMKETGAFYGWSLGKILEYLSTPDDTTKEGACEAVCILRNSVKANVVDDLLALS